MKRGAAEKEDIMRFIRNEKVDEIDLLCWGTQANQTGQGNCPHIKCSSFQSLDRTHSFIFHLSEKLHRKLDKDLNIPPCFCEEPNQRDTVLSTFLLWQTMFWNIPLKPARALSENCSDLN